MATCPNPENVPILEDPATTLEGRKTRIAAGALAGLTAMAIRAPGRGGMDMAAVVLCVVAVEVGEGRFWLLLISGVVQQQFHF
jgi:hypothetical protein